MAGSSVAEARTRDCIGGQAASSCSSPFRPAVKHIGHPNYVQFAVPIGHGGAVEFAAAIDERGGSARSSNSLANQIDIPEHVADRSEEHTSELQSLMRISYAVFCLKKKKRHIHTQHR